MNTLKVKSKKVHLYIFSARIFRLVDKNDRIVNRIRNLPYKFLHEMNVVRCTSCLYRIFQTLNFY